MFWMINSNEYVNKWILIGKYNMVYENPLVNTYLDYTRSAEFKKYKKRQCEGLPIQT